MNQRIIVQHRQHQRHSGSVVRAQGSSFCPEDTVPHFQIDPFIFKIMLYTGEFLTYHIHVSLEHHRRMILHAAASRLPDDNVKRLILIYLEISLCGKLYQIITDSFLVA